MLLDMTNTIKDIATITWHGVRAEPDSIRQATDPAEYAKHLLFLSSK